MSEPSVSSRIDFSSSSGAVSTGLGLESGATTDLSFPSKLSQATQQASQKATQQTSYGKERSDTSHKEAVKSESAVPSRTEIASKASDSAEHASVEKPRTAKAEQNELNSNKAESIHSEAAGSESTSVTAADKNQYAVEDNASVSDDLAGADTLPLSVPTVEEKDNSQKQVADDAGSTLPVVNDEKTAQPANSGLLAADGERSDTIKSESAKPGTDVEVQVVSSSPGIAAPDAKKSSTEADVSSVTVGTSSGSKSTGSDDVAVISDNAKTTASDATEPSLEAQVATEKSTEQALKASAERTESAPSTPRSLAPGDQLTPAALANRQAHLAGATPVTRQNVTQAVEEQGVDATQSDGQNEAVRATTLTRGVMLEAKATTPALVPADSVAETTDMPLRAVTMEDAEAAATEQQLKQQAEHQSAQAATAISEEQLSEDKQIIKNQAQVQQFNQLQGAAAISASQASNDDSVKTSAPVVDNVLHSLAGGTVTAPVPSRAETGNVQTIYAPINTPILQNDADKAMAGNIRWMESEGVKNATINLTPNGMGPIQVSIGMDKDQMNVAIVASHGSTREALESMVPRLREQLGLQGHTSINVDISDGRSENPGRGSAEQSASNQSGSEQNSRAQGMYRDSDSRSPAGADTTAVQGQGLMNVNISEKIAGRYDVYV